MLNKIIKFGLYLFIFLLPWQTRWIFKDAYINSEVWEYGRWSLYGTEIILLIILILGVIKWLVDYRQLAKPERINQIKNEFKGVKLWLLLFITWSALSLLWAKNAGLAWYGWLKLAEGLGLFWIITNIMLINHESNTNKSRISLKSITHLLIIAGVIQALLGISQFIKQTNIQANKWLGLSFLDVTAPGTSVIEFLDQRWLRAYGGLPHPNVLAGFLVICLLLVIINLWQHNRQVVDVRKASYLNAFYWLSAIVLFLGLLLTFSRGAWLAFAICFVSSFIYWLIKKSRVVIKLNLTLIIIFIAAFTLFWVSYPTLLVTTRFNPEARLEKKSVDLRLASYQQAKVLLRDNPLLGTGLNNYTDVLYQKDSRWPGYVYQPVHDAGLLTLVELGIPGLLFFILIIISALRQRSQYLLLLLAIIILGLFDHYLRTIYFGTMLWWLVVGINFVPSKSVAR